MSATAPARRPRRRCRRRLSARSTWRAGRPGRRPCALRAGRARQQRGEGAAERDDEHGERVAAAARLEKALAQMQQVAARLHFAGAPHVGGDRRERRRTDCSPATTAWSAMIAPNSSGNASSERSNSLRGEQQRRGQTGAVPRADASGARAQVVGRQRVDNGHRVARRGWPCAWPARVRPAPARRVEAVDDQRLQAAAEELARGRARAS